MGQPLTTEARGGCTHCGLVAPAGDSFCCYGCELAHALTANDENARHRAVGRLTASLLLAMIVMMMSLFLYAEDIYEAGTEPLYLWLRAASGWAALVLSTGVMALLGPPLATRAFRSVVAGRLTMELLVGVAASAAWGVSVVNVVVGRPTIYFDSATAALLLATYGRFIEAEARSRAAGVVGRLLEPSAQPVLAGADGALVPMSPAAVDPGMTVVVPLDGVVPVDVRATGEAEVSLAILHGESLPTRVAPGDDVPAGAVVVSGSLHGVALRRKEHSTLAQLERLTRALLGARGRLLRVADRLAAWLTPVVGVIALAALVGWSNARDLGTGVEVALAVVLVACPCTYGVITPLIAWLALRKALEHDVCVRDASVLDALAGVRSLAFDKTGTLTEPLADVKLEIAPGQRSEDVWSVAAALEQGVPQPLARRIAVCAGATEVQLVGRQVEPRGVSARTSTGHGVAIGAVDWLSERGVAVAAPWANHVAVLALDGHAVAAFQVAERVRPEAAEACRDLRAQGLNIALWSGDRSRRVEPVAQQLGIETWAGDLLPADKVARLVELDAAALVGDGMNDAPAAAAALASFSVDGAASLHRGVADVVLLSADLRLVPWSIALARRTLAISRQTLALATLYNVVFLALAAVGWLRPVWAGVSMLAASVIALGGALRMTSYPAPPGADLCEPSRAPSEQRHELEPLEARV